MSSCIRSRKVKRQALTDRLLLAEEGLGEVERVVPREHDLDGYGEDAAPGLSEAWRERGKERKAFVSRVIEYC